MATGPPSEGPKPPDVTVPMGSLAEDAANSKAPARMGARVCDRRPTRRLAGPLSNCCSTGKSPAASAAAATDLRHCPLERRFDRRCILSDIRPVKAKASLGPQTVASAEADKRD